MLSSQTFARRCGPAATRRGPRSAVKRSTQLRPVCALQRAGSDGVSAFQLHPFPVLKPEDIKDAVEVCSCISSQEQRCKCYETFGLDGRKVERYWERTMMWERALDMGDETGRTVARCGGVLLSLLLASKLC